VSRILLISTYELGGQPLGLSGPATALLSAGHEVRAHDLAVEPWPDAEIAWAEAVACSVPMHTALRLGLAAVERIRTEHPEMPVAYYGLYAPVAAEFDVLEDHDLAVADGVAEALIAFADSVGPRGPRPRSVDGRALLEPLGSYATYVDRDGERLVGPVESSVGCNHRCRHCPVPIVFDGRSRPIPIETILSDVESLVALGATHLHFADPDFLNRPQHALRVSAAIHELAPELTFDATIKVTHLLRHVDILGQLAARGLRFVISAFESTSDLVLSELDKGHSRADLPRAVAALRAVGIEPRPSFLPFTPWTTRDDLVDLLDFVAAHDLVHNVDGVQYGIRLLLPPGSLMLDRPDHFPHGALGAFDEIDLGTTWRSHDPLLDELAVALAEITAELAEAGASHEETYATVRAVTFTALERDDPGVPEVTGPVGPPGIRPHLTEAWFCCAEPTPGQLDRMGTHEERGIETVEATPVILGRTRR
jgi:hypothetical protein